MNSVCDIIEILQLKMENERSKEQSRRISLLPCRQLVWVKDNIKNRQTCIKYWMIKQGAKNIKMMYILQWKEWQTIFWECKITADGDCSHEIKRCLLLGRKIMTNLDNLLKSRDITLSTNVHIVKAMIFPVVMYGCESWIKEMGLKSWIKKTKHQRIDAFEGWCWRRLLRVPWTASRSNKSILKEIGPEYSLEWLMLKLKHQYFDHLMWRTDIGKDPDTRKNWRLEEKGTTEDEMFGWHRQLNGHEFE